MSKTTVNPDLAKARASATFDPLQLTYFLYNGREKTNRKRYVQSLASHDFKKQGFRRLAHLTREEHYEEALRKSCFAFKRVEELGLTDPLDNMYYRGCLIQGAEPFAIHIAAFITTLNKLASEEQKAKWLPLIRSWKMIGTYCQTELGHGSFLRGLETTATYDPKTKEFIINSPSITAAKWWPGGLGKTANCCVVMAKLFIKGKDVGMQSFVVQIRDYETHEPLPGISVGDIGPKFGYQAMDNGYLLLNNVRVPRENMLMRYSKVLEDGTFVQPENDRLIYGSMTALRSGIVGNCALAMCKAVTIATRYSAVRKQSEIMPGAGEVPILEYQTMQHKLFVQIARAFALDTAGKSMHSLASTITAEIERGDLQNLPILHALSSGLKSFCAWEMMDGIEQCRLACGGHGYSLASGIPSIYTHDVPAATYEGENTVLCLQTARFLLKCQNAMAQGEQLPALARYMQIAKGAKSRLTNKLELPHLVAAYEYRAAKAAAEAATRMNSLLKQGMKPALASDASSQLQVEASVAFSHAYVVRALAEKIQQAKDLPASVTDVLTQVCQLYACVGINKHSGQFLKGGFMTERQIEMVHLATFDLLASLKPNAVALVDAFDFPDEQLDSAIGRYDGNVYEALFDFARSSWLNETEIHPGYYKYLKPFMDSFGQPQAKL